MKNHYGMGNLLRYICLFPYDTRVVSLYNRDGSLFSIDIDGNQYSYFRIIRVYKNHCTLLILEENNTYSSTNQTITVDIHWIGAIKCIQDINL